MADGSMMPTSMDSLSTREMTRTIHFIWTTTHGYVSRSQMGRLCGSTTTARRQRPMIDAVAMHAGEIEAFVL